jgi:hypothetical protein
MPRGSYKFQTPPPGLPLGETVAYLIRQVEPWDRPLLLQFLEKECRRTGDLPSLREIRAYKNRVEPKT